MGTITDALGLTDYSGAEALAEASIEAAQLSADISKEQLEFSKEQYEDWKAIYGPLQEDLGTYFKNISGDTISAKQISEIQRASQQSQQQTEQLLAQRGLSGSGLEAAALMQNQFSTSMAKASARANADQLAAQQKMGFLGMGLGQGSNLSNQIANVAGNYASNQMGFANTQLQAATNLNTANMGFMQDIAGLGTAYAIYGGN